VDSLKEGDTGFYWLFLVFKANISRRKKLQKRLIKLTMRLTECMNIELELDMKANGMVECDTGGEL
jgi:hypothetical protein